MFTRRSFLKAAALGGSALYLNPLSLRQAQGAVKQIVVGQGVDMPSLDPYGHSVTFNYAMWKHIMEPIVRYDYWNRKYVSALAESWKAEGTEWTFSLRKGIKFHNGADFTANDIVFSYEKIKAGSKQAANLMPITDMKVLDNYTVKLITKDPFSPLPSRLKQHVIVSQQYYKQAGEKALQAPVGTGPFKFAEWVRGNYFVVKKNESYWDTPAQVDQVIWKPIPEDAARVTALETGAVDIATNIPPHEVDRLSSKAGIKVERVRAMRSIHVGLPMRFKPFQNRLVRQAMNYAVDIDSLIKYVLDGMAYRAAGISGPNAFGYNSDIKPYPYDPAKAKSLLAEAGYPNGFDVDFYSPSGRYVKDKEAAEAMVGQLAKVGVRAKLIVQEWSVFWSGVMEGKFPMYLFGGFNEEDPDIFLSLYFETGVTKRLEYSNPQVDKGIKDLRQTFDPERRERMLKEVVKTLHEDCPTIILWHPQDLYGINEKLTWKPTPDEEASLYGASVR
jgi:peptide/nickel transport system substrate-binding protein